MGKKVVNDDQLLQSTEKSRRRFVKKVLVGSAFAAPLIASFPMNGLKADSARAVTFGNACPESCAGLSGLEWFACVIRRLLCHFS